MSKDVKKDPLKAYLAMNAEVVRHEIEYGELYETENIKNTEEYWEVSNLVMDSNSGTDPGRL